MGKPEMLFCKRDSVQGDNDDDAEKSGDKPKRENVRDFSEVATTHGVYYAFERGVYPVSNLFWILTCLALFCLAAFFIITAYTDWKGDPILTTVETTGHPIDKLDFPAVTICGQGTIQETINQAFVIQIRDYWAEKGVEIDVHMDFDELMREYGSEFMRETFPGAQINPMTIVSQMASQDPDSMVEAEVAVSGGNYDPCASLAIFNDTSTNTTTTTTEWTDSDRCPGTTYEAISDRCYAIMDKANEADAAEGCYNRYYGHLFDLDGTSTQMAGLIAFVNGTTLDNKWFWTTPFRRDGIEFYTTTGVKLNDTPAVKDGYIELGEVTNTNRNCFVLRWDPDKMVFDGKQSLCDYDTTHQTLCQIFPETRTDCSADTSGSKKKKRRRKRDDVEWDTKLDNLINPLKKAEIQRNKDMARREYREAFDDLDMAEIYESLFELLWYSQLPCFDVRDYTSDHSFQRSLLKKCWWKGVSIDCSAIFRTFPTDRGMCCTFNMAAADEIFNDSKYKRKIETLQERDANNTFGSSALPAWFTNGNEPKPQQGVSKGLTVMLDAHTNQIASSTVYDNFQGFMAVINSRDSYPITSQGNIRIRPGHETLVAIDAVDVQADQDSVQSVALDKRKCLFPDEGYVVGMKFHKNYTHASCILECQMSYVQNQSLTGDDLFCTPWYLPTLDQDLSLCDPWDAVDFRETLEEMTESCSHCFPDCASTMYTKTVTAVPFRRCDNKNLGISFMCNLDGDEMVVPPLFGAQVAEEYAGELPTYLGEEYSTNMREYSTDMEDEIFSQFTENNQKYNAYENDIALVHFYFEHPTVFQYKRAQRMTPVDFLSQVGGLMGLCLGISFASLVEIVYWFLWRIWFGCRKSNNVNNSNGDQDRAPSGDSMIKQG